MAFLAPAWPARADGAPQASAVLRLGGETVRRPWVEVTPLAGKAPASIFTPEEGARSVPLAGVPPGLAIVCAGGDDASVRCVERALDRGAAAEVLRAGGGVRTTGLVSVGRMPASGAVVSVVPYPLIARRPFTLPLSRGKGGRISRGVRCDGRGRFTLPPLAPGTYRLEVRTGGGRADHGSAFTLPEPAALRKQGDDPHRPPLYDLGTWALDEGVAVEVAVVDSLGSPIPGASVGAMQRKRDGEILEFEARTREDGMARLARVDPVWPLHISCLAPGFVTLQKEFASAPAGTRCELARVAAIEGTVLDEADRPVAGASITLRRTARTATSGGRGTFTLGGLEPGEYRLVAAKGGLRAVEREVALAPGERKTLPALRLSPGDRLTGRVVDAETSVPVPGAMVEVTEPPGEGSTMADAEGRFVLTVGSDSALDLRVTADGYPAAIVPVGRTDTRTEPVTARLSRGGRIQATVWSRELDAPCAGCNITLTSASGEAASLVTGMDGEALSDPLAPGAWQAALLHVESSGSVVVVQGGEEVRTVEVRAGATASVVFGERSALAVSFSAPLAPGWAVMARAGTTASVGREQADGSYSVRRPPGEALALSLTGPLFEEVRQTVIPADFEEPEITLPLPSTDVSGLLVRGEKPLPRANLTLVAAMGGSGAATARTGEDGSFSISYLPPGVYTLVVEGQPLRPVEVAAGKPIDLGVIELPAP